MRSNKSPVIKILFFQPYTHGRTTSPPLGLAYLASYVLKKFSFRVVIRVIDNDEKKFSDEDLKRYVKKFNPKIIGITVNILNQNNAIRNASIFKNYPFVIFGGPQPTLNPVFFLRAKNFFVIKGEGEIIFCNIVKAVMKNCDIHLVKGVTYLNSSGDMVDSPRELLIKNLDELPFPVLKLFDYDKYRTYINGKRSTIMLSSRGCPFKCIYCYHQLNASFRQRSIENIIKEMFFYRNEYGIKAIKFFDDNFTLRRTFIVNFCKQLIEQKVGMIWSCLSSARNVDQELLNYMNKAGCYSISFGIESGSQKSLKMMGKKTTVAQNRAAIKMCRKARIISKAYIMIGFPWETKDDILETGWFLRRCPPDIAQILIVTPMPNTALEKMINEAGYKIDKSVLECTRDFNMPTFETENFSKEELSVLYKEITHMYETSPLLKVYKIQRKIKRRVSQMVDILSM